MKISLIKFLFIGRIDPIKNLHHFINFLENYSDGTKIIFRIIGPDYGGVKLFPTVKKIKLELLEPCYDEDIKKMHFMWSDYCVLVSEFEALSMFLLEALRNSKLVIVNEASWPFINFESSCGYKITKFEKCSFDDIYIKLLAYDSYEIEKFYNDKFDTKKIHEKIYNEFVMQI